jgi:hypothetical protein
MRLVACLAATSMLFAACSPAAPTTGSKQADIVATAAVQTLTAIPKATASQAALEPTATLPPTATTAPTAVPPTATPSFAVVASGPTNFPANINPLTGLQVADPTILNRRPVLIKVSNWPAVVRPQSGLSSADIVFEYYIGEGMNRFVGLFYGQNAAKVGSIRSGRLVDAQLGPLYQAVLASSGAYVTVENAIDKALGNRVINEGSGACPMFCRDDKISSPNNLFADTSKVTEYAQTHGADPKTKQNLDGMAFNPAVPTTGKAAQQLTVQINDTDRGGWTYDAVSGAYLRSIENIDAKNNLTMVPLADANTKKQLAFNNVVVIYATYTELAPTMNNIALSQAGVGGKAVLFRDGKAIEGTWKSQGPTSPLTFFGADGKPMPFKPGNSWFALMGIHSQTTEKDGVWQVIFNLP